MMPRAEQGERAIRHANTSEINVSAHACNYCAYPRYLVRRWGQRRMLDLERNTEIECEVWCIIG